MPFFNLRVLLLHFAVRLTPTRSVQTAINALGDLSDSRTPSVSVPHELYRALVSDERLRGNVDSQSDDKWASASTTVMAKPAVGAKGGATDQLRLARNSDSGPGLPKERRSASAAERWRNVSTEQHTQADLFNAGIVNSTETSNSAAAAMPMTLDFSISAPPPALFVPMAGVLSFLLCIVMLYIDIYLDPGDSDSHAGEVQSERLVSSSNSRANLSRQKLDQIFQVCDRDRDGFVSYSELLWLARLTGPERARGVTRGWFSDLCLLIGADPHRGLDCVAFQRSYQLLGGDIDREYEAVNNAMPLFTPAPPSAEDHLNSCKDRATL